MADGGGKGNLEEKKNIESNHIIFRTNPIIYGTNPITYRKYINICIINSVMIKTIPVISTAIQDIKKNYFIVNFRTKTLIFRSNPVISKTNPIILRTSSIAYLEQIQSYSWKIHSYLC